MSLISFGEYLDNSAFKVLDERQVRASAGIMFFLGLVAFIQVNFLKNSEVIIFISGFLLLNFTIGIFINPKFSPTMILAKIIVKKQSPLPIGAVQKKFAWTIGFFLALSIFTLSILHLDNVHFFEPLCLLCLICLAILFLESSFGICIGCKIYRFFIRFKIIPKPKVNPNCMGDACEIN